MAKKKVIFLDFDGVLNTERHQQALRLGGWKRQDEYGPLFDPEAVENLMAVLSAVPEALIVVNSSWKLEGMDWILELWSARDLPGKVYGVTPDYVPDLLNIDLDDYDNIVMLAGKGNEVKQWIAEHAPGGCHYVIFDDMPDFLPEQEEHLIRTDPYVGITAENAAAAIQILTE